MLLSPMDLSLTTENGGALCFAVVIVAVESHLKISNWSQEAAEYSVPEKGVFQDDWPLEMI